MEKIVDVSEEIEAAKKDKTIYWFPNFMNAVLNKCWKDK